MTRQPLGHAQALASRLLMQAAATLMGPRQTRWARAMQAEVAAIDNEREALRFAWGCFRAAVGCAPARLLARLARPGAGGVWACSAAVLLGCLFMHRAGAPGHYVWMNLLSLAFAVATFWMLPRQRLQADGLLRARLCCAMGTVLLAASMGPAAAGGAVWLRAGPVPLNLTWLLLPALLVASDGALRAAERRWALTGLMMGLGALALQADAWLAALAAVVLGMRSWRRRDPRSALLAGVASAIALHAGQKWQATDAVPFVDRVLQRGFNQELAVGLAVAVALLLPLWPALLHRAAREHGLLWALIVVLSLPGWLPSPWVGFGGSLIVGYLLSLALIPGPGDASDRITTTLAPQVGHRAEASNGKRRTWPSADCQSRLQPLR